MFRVVQCVFVAFCAFVTRSEVFAAKQSPPHIVFVLADDLVSILTINYIKGIFFT